MTNEGEARLLGRESPELGSPYVREPEQQYRRIGRRTASSGIKHPWEEAADGNITRLRRLPTAPEVDEFFVPGVAHQKLGQLQATAIAGNDITSSCLYSAGITVHAGGMYAPICVSLVAMVLFLFRSIYTEVCTALPMNGGTYNALLNTTNKTLSALAAVLTLLSYTATAVVSASSAAKYLSYGVGDLPDLWLTLGILLIFAIITFMGISESANVAVVLFIVHLITLLLLVGGGLSFLIKDKGSQLKANWDPSNKAANPKGTVFKNLFDGYAGAMLGVTGFETSANYIEEQRPGVFPKTLRNMWIAVAFFNPTITVLSMAAMPIEELNGNRDFALASMAETTVGTWLKWLVIVDATLVLSAAVLTSYIGILGLVRRMSLDRLMPRILMHTNKWRDTNHFIIFGFFAITASLRLLVGDDMTTLSGVYAIAFLSVMSLFAMSNLVLKFKRSQLPRKPNTPIPQVIVALFFVLCGTVGNFFESLKNAEFFVIYFVIFATVVFFQLVRVTATRFFLFATRDILPTKWRDALRASVMHMRSQRIFFFTKDSQLNLLNKAVNYAVNNEETGHVIIVYCENPANPHNKEIVADFEENCAVLDTLHPKTTVSLVIAPGPFSPVVVDQLSRYFDVPKNFMFMSCPSNRFPHQIGHFGGVRVITHGGAIVYHNESTDEFESENRSLVLAAEEEPGSQSQLVPPPGSRPARDSPTLQSQDAAFADN